MDLYNSIIKTLLFHDDNTQIIEKYFLCSKNTISKLLTKGK